ncbi:hypothetical protein M2093_002389 [Breznakia sp. PH1-1]|nr:hypothetical protein [Breznakia sp. PH1-1]MDH6405302.1 hypothetical protein [Breznakia sp. PF1-11]MDH6413013.1 hypothetical protein [Breznakia sp. PFB1-11]MDH6415377.1 hypothetical protein [Breznakia sp. PFB1-14]MDH6417680.1 hypothetical protein [Breznakia sp. PFB1-4]MDH6420049.1 hypothetical protein [Breznakia sp. PFB1-12]MDH6475117.1 hypothetical protein [Breznakia sp. PFB2-30]MDH6477421.1 hypothetical protein [Breznakia sp. PFB1-19]
MEKHNLLHFLISMKNISINPNTQNFFKGHIDAWL